MAQKDDHFLIGSSRSKIFGRKPPTLRKLLQHVAFENLGNKKNVLDSVKVVVNSAMHLWETSTTQTMRFDHITEKLRKEYVEWLKLRKEKNKDTVYQISQRAILVQKLDNAFDVAAKPSYKKSTGSSEASGSSDFPQMETDEIGEIGEIESLQLEDNVPGQSSMEADSGRATKKRPTGIQTGAQKQKHAHLDDEYVESKYLCHFFFTRYSFSFFTLISRL